MCLGLHANMMLNTLNPKPNSLEIHRFIRVLEHLLNVDVKSINLEHQKSCFYIGVISICGVGRCARIHVRHNSPMPLGVKVLGETFWPGTFRPLRYPVGDKGGITSLLINQHFFTSCWGSNTP